MGDGLIKRLNARHTLDTPRETRTGALVNPDGPEAASRIAELKAERDDALRQFMNATPFSKDEIRQLCADHAETVAELKAKLATAVGALERIEGWGPATCETSLAHDMAQAASVALRSIQGSA